MRVCVCVHTRVLTLHIWRSKDNFGVFLPACWEQDLSPTMLQVSWPSSFRDILLCLPSCHSGYTAYPLRLLSVGSRCGAQLLSLSKPAVVCTCDPSTYCERLRCKCGISLEFVRPCLQSKGQRPLKKDHLDSA